MSIAAAVSSLLLILLVLPAHAQTIAGVAFVQVFEPQADADPAQCTEQANGLIKTRSGDWSPFVKYKMDARKGGCEHRFAIIDTAARLVDLQISVSHWGDGDATQCGAPGTRDIPRLARDPDPATPADWSQPLLIDTDARRGGCVQRWSLRGRNDAALDIDFVPDGEAEQCGNAGSYTVTSQSVAQFLVNTTDQPGGCLLRFRLRGIAATRR